VDLEGRQEGRLGHLGVPKRKFGTSCQALYDTAEKGREVNVSREEGEITFLGVGSLLG